MCEENCGPFAVFQNKVVIPGGHPERQSKSFLTNKGKGSPLSRLGAKECHCPTFLPSGIWDIKCCSVFLGRWPALMSASSWYLLSKFSFLGRLLQASWLFIISKSFPMPQFWTRFASTVPKCHEQCLANGLFHGKYYNFLSPWVSVFLFSGF